jgi:uncharacterized glyoxalase superfamily protein PhnB
MPNVKPVPDGFRTVTPYLTVRGVDKLIDFVKGAFNAEEVFMMRGPDGHVSHAEFRIGDSIIMMGEARGEWQPSSTTLYLYVPDCDSVYNRALSAGGTSVQELTDQFYGDRSGGVKDPCGNMWWIATHKEDVSPEELQRRAQAMYGAKPEAATAAAGD